MDDTYSLVKSYYTFINSGVHREKGAGKRQRQEVESHSKTHEEEFYIIKQEVTRMMIELSI